jgi:hypothetical protein
MVSAISNLISSSGATSATASSKRVESSAASAQAPATSTSSSGLGGTDTVSISKDAQALALYTQGMDLAQIAFRLGVDVDTLKRLLGLTSEAATSAGGAQASTSTDFSPESLAAAMRHSLGLYTRSGSVA